MSDIKIKIDDKEFDISYQEDKNKIMVNGNIYEINMLKSLNSNNYSFAVNNNIKHIEIKEEERNRNKLLLNGFEYDVSISDELSEMLNKFMKQSGKNGNGGGSKIKAPMPGMVIKVLVEENQEIQKGDNVLIVEAMKMENSLQSTVSGRVKKIYVNQGQAVEKDALLIDIEVNV